MSRTLAYFAFVTVYLLGQTIGGILSSPISETFGRRTLYIIATFVFGLSSALVAAIPSVVAVYIGRFLQGVAAAIPATVAFGNFADLFTAHQRIWVVFGYTVSGFIGIALGPIYASYVAARLGWRWIFYISTIVSAVSAALSFTVRESRPEQVLEAKAQILRRETGRAAIYVHHAADAGGFSLQAFVHDSLFRPLEFLVREPIVLFCAALCAVAFGLVYGLTAGLTVAYTTPPLDHTFTALSSSLAFIAILIGILLDVIPRVYDDSLFRTFQRTGRRIVPETKIRSFAVACPVLAVGLWIFAWTVPPRVVNVPWPVSMIGLVCIGFSSTDFSYVLFGYVTDCYGPYASSAAASLSTTRTIAAAVFPLFTHQMFSGLGTNIAVTILAAIATVFTFTPFLFLRYGSKLRHLSKMALDDVDCLPEENEHLSKGDESSNASPEKV
jgi:MFS family permease